MKEILNAADLVATDGMMLVRICRLLGVRSAERVYGPDVMLELCRRSPACGYKHYFYGGAPGIAATLAQRMKEKYPGLIVAGVYSPPFRPLNEDELSEIASLINERTLISYGWAWGLRNRRSGSLTSEVV